MSKKDFIKKEQMVAITDSITGEMDTAKITMIVQRDKPKYKEPFTILFQATTRAMSREISPAASKLLIHISSIVSYGNVVPSTRNEMAEEIGYSARQIDRALAELIKMQVIYVELHPEDRRSKVYYVNALQSWKGEIKDRKKKIATYNSNQLDMFKPTKEIGPNKDFDLEK
jgi:predicted transcriptional regulator